MALASIGTATEAVSAYELTVHFSVTMWLAELAGFPESEAYELAKYDQAADDDPETEPLGGLDSQSIQRRALYHFVTGQRLQELDRLALQCTVDQRTATDYRRMGQHLHAFEDIYAHRGYGPRLGHIFAGHTPDFPWSKPAEFLEMLDRKFQRLITLRSRCFPRLRSERDMSRFAAVRPMLEEWRNAERDAGVGDENGPARLDGLLRRLFSDRYSVYTEQRLKAYNTWRDTQGWRKP